MKPIEEKSKYRYPARIEKEDNEIEFEDLNIKKMSMEQANSNEFRIRPVYPPDCQAAGIHKESSLMTGYIEKFMDDDVEEEDQEKTPQIFKVKEPSISFKRRRQSSNTDYQIPSTIKESEFDICEEFEKFPAKSDFDIQEEFDLIEEDEDFDLHRNPQFKHLNSDNHLQSANQRETGSHTNPRGDTVLLVEREFSMLQSRLNRPKEEDPKEEEKDKPKKKQKWSERMKESFGKFVYKMNHSGGAFSQYNKLDFKNSHKKAIRLMGGHVFTNPKCKEDLENIFKNIILFTYRKDFENPLDSINK